ncbi:hypothetical protein MPSEU_000465400 [Mayamaea pseudoterrestris]|nr:hypothetical protein MPSEU_000465400 [Mayamaea pseudoterrestris]
MHYNINTIKACSGESIAREASRERADENRPENKLVLDDGSFAVRLEYSSTPLPATTGLDDDRFINFLCSCQEKDLDELDFELDLDPVELEAEFGITVESTAAAVDEAAETLAQNVTEPVEETLKPAEEPADAAIVVPDWEVDFKTIIKMQAAGKLVGDDRVFFQYVLYLHAQYQIELMAAAATQGKIQKEEELLVPDVPRAHDENYLQSSGTAEILIEVTDDDEEEDFATPDSQQLLLRKVDSSATSRSCRPPLPTRQVEGYAARRARRVNCPKCNAVVSNGYLKTHMRNKHRDDDASDGSAKGGSHAVAAAKELATVTDSEDDAQVLAAPAGKESELESAESLLADILGNPLPSAFEDYLNDLDEEFKLLHSTRMMSSPTNNQDDAS